MLNRYKKTLIFRIGFICILITIYFLSNQEGEVSRQLSNHVARLLPIEFFDENSPSSIPLFIGLSIRNYAHVVLYAVLGVFVFLALENKKNIWQRPLLALGICYLCACMDEFHQLFIPGRNARLMDTFFDAAGFVPAVVFCFLLNRIKNLKSPKS